MKVKGCCDSKAFIAIVPHVLDELYLPKFDTVERECLGPTVSVAWLLARDDDGIRPIPWHKKNIEFRIYLTSDLQHANVRQRVSSS